MSTTKTPPRQLSLILLLGLLGWGVHAGAAVSKDCKQAQIDWGILNEAMPVYITDKGDYRPAWDGDTYRGERQYIPDESRAELVQAAEDRIFRSCKEPEDIRARHETYNGWIQSEYCKVAQVKYDAASRTRTPRDDLERIREQMEEQCRR